MENKQIILFLEKFGAAVDKKELIKLIIAKPRNASSELKSILVTLVELKSGLRLNLVYRHKTKDITRNHPTGEALEIIRKSLSEDFYNADLFTLMATVQLVTARRGKVRIKTTPATSQAPATFSHDHVKERVISTEQNIYLRELGILNANFEVRREMADKYRQINRYIELIGPEIGALQLPEVFHVADMGSGKGYLTFALYDFLTAMPGKKPVMTGIEARQDLVDLSNAIAVKAEFPSLRFIKGTIADAALEKIDILVALHACDTATDDAIFRGISSGASLIICAPCCHKQIRKEFNLSGALKQVMKHGILMERQAEIITDGLRALIMESQGYRTRIFEFVSTEHTPKNLLILGKKSSVKPEERERILQDITRIKELFGIGQHHLEMLLTR